jgi:two-component system cell cycle sensor histidine kinase/response regulator CckA
MDDFTRTQSYLRLIEAVSRGGGVADVCEAALDCVQGSLGFTRTSILTFDAQGVMRFRAWRGVSERYRAGVEGHSPWQPETRDASVVLVPDVALEPSLGAVRDVVLAEGIRSLAFVPLAANGNLLGKLMVYGETSESCDEAKLREAAIVGDQIALALDRQRAHERLSELNELLVAISESMPEALAFVDDTGIVRYANERLLALFGFGSGAVMGRRADDVAVEIAAQIAGGEEALSRWHADMALHQPTTRELQHLDGRQIEVVTAPVLTGGEYRGRLVQYRDVTARRRDEKRLLHAQKMESIGRLAGGVAHDFNNMLTAMIGYMDLVAASLPPGSEEHGFLSQALEAAEQAAGLTSQLLTFARRQPGKPSPQKLDDLIVRMTPLVRRLVPESIDIVTQPAAAPAWVLADPGELEQILLNLVFNARDAMAEGGMLELATFVLPGEGEDGADAVALEVADSGVGMSADVMAQVFEPFYTTKADGHGTGLGLATVYGMVQQYGGRVEVSSEPGHGARFRVLLPRIPAPASAGGGPGGGTQAPGGTETVLVVEDDATVRGLVTAMLTRLGYTVHSSEDPEAALGMLAGPGASADLLIADVVMPGMSGRELASRALAMHPRLRILLTSGYSEAPQLPDSGLGFAFLPKPFSIDTLARRVREVLGAPAIAGS